MDNKKIFSVIIPMYNAELTISRTLASLISNIDYIKEIIIVNDNSTDNCVNVANRYKDIFKELTIINSSGRHNPGVARKCGLLHSTGDWVTFLDADDCLTPSSLRYVYEQLEDDMILLHCKTIYYESGYFGADNIEYQDNSCGGNFYKREYLIENDLLPHDTLSMAEDEYFNEIIRLYITYYDDTITSDNAIQRYDYPVYEVHHDIEDGESYALANWNDYSIRYHLLYNRYVVDFFNDLIPCGIKGAIEIQELDDLIGEVMRQFINGFVFCYFMMVSIETTDDDFDANQYTQDFSDALHYFESNFGESGVDIINFLDNDEVDSISISVSESVGLPMLNGEETISKLIEFIEEINYDI